MTFLKRIAGAAALGAALLTGSSLLASPAQAGYVVILEEVGNDVAATGGGIIDLTGLSFVGESFVGAGIIPVIGAIVTGPTDVDTFTGYTGFTGPTSFGSGGGGAAGSGSGDIVGIFGSENLLRVPLGYVSGDPLSDISTYIGADFTTLGVTPGTYEWTWGTGPNQNFTLVIGAAAVPEPASAVLLGAALAGLLLAGTIRCTRHAT